MKIEYVSSYPLQWPVGVPRNTNRKKPAFNEFAWNTSLDELARQVRLLGGRQMIVSTNVPTRKDGLPYATYKRIDDPGVALWFMLDGQPLCFPCDKWLTVGLNMRAIAMNLDAMRAMQRWGVGTVKQQFTGYLALTSGTPVESWWEVLECTPDASLDQIEAQYHARVKTAHPDAGGSHEAMARLNAARTQAKVARS